MAQVSAARNAAFLILLAIERGEGHSDDLLRTEKVSRLSAADRNLTTALVLGVLRWQIALEAALRPLLKKPNAKLDIEVLIAMRIGAFQLLHMDRIPARAAIDESVELTKRAGHRFASAMVNAVLRKVAASGTAPAATDTAAYPDWITHRWTKLFGEERACAICSYGQAQPALALRTEDPAAETDLTQAGVQLAPGELLVRARIVLSGDITASEAFREGRVRIQDEGSQLVAEIAGQGSAILDCCAAPGGKTLILAERNPQARIVACEVSAPRLDALRKRLGPLGNRVECRLGDAMMLTYENEFDLVLADVPCSGTGTLGRNPEIRHRLRAEDLARQADRQRLILASAVRAAKPEGRAVYSTCSLEPEEDEQVLAALSCAEPAFRIVPIVDRLEQMQREGILIPGAVQKLNQCITPEGYLRLFPGQFGTDGFFVALLEKTGSSR